MQPAEQLLLPERLPVVQSAVWSVLLPEFLPAMQSAVQSVLLPEFLPADAVGCVVGAAAGVSACGAAG